MLGGWIVNGGWVDRWIVDDGWVGRWIVDGGWVDSGWWVGG